MLTLFSATVRASVRAVESRVTVKEGEEARLECEVHGNPQPTVSWEKQVDLTLSLSSIKNRGLLIISARTDLFHRPRRRPAHAPPASASPQSGETMLASTSVRSQSLLQRFPPGCSRMIGHQKRCSGQQWGRSTGSRKSDSLSSIPSDNKVELLSRSSRYHTLFIT